MAARIQQKILALSLGKQSAIGTASTTSAIRFKQLNSQLTSTGFNTENDAAETGKGHEFTTAAGVFPVSYTPGGRIDKYASAEWMVWAFCYGLGNVTEVGGLYTVVPIDPSTLIELPYFTVIEQVAEGGGFAIANEYIGCAIEDLTYDFNYGPGRASSKLSINWVGSGKIADGSGLTVGAVQTENYMLSQSMALSINGVDYVGAKTVLSGSFGWKNNLLLNAGFFPGSGLQNSAAIRGRMEIGARVPTFTFTVRLLSTSAEYTKLIAQTTGTVVLTITFDSTHTATITLQSVSFEMVENTETDGIVAVTVTCAVKQHATNGVVTFTGKCGSLTGIAQ